jgi:hypothetical protein
MNAPPVLVPDHLESREGSSIPANDHPRVVCAYTVFGRDDLICREHARDVISDRLLGVWLGRARCSALGTEASGFDWFIARKFVTYP